MEDGSNRLTPRNPVTDERHELRVSSADYLKIRRGPGWLATVTDLETGKRYAVMPAPCSSPRCYCDAVAIEIAE